MTSVRAALSRVRGLFLRERADHELHDELDVHLLFHIDDNIRAGMTPDEARRRALIKLGGVEQTKEQYRERRGVPLLEHAIHEVRYTLRALRHSPTVTTIAVLTLALGIGANTAIFSVVDAVMWRPLPYPQPERLVALWETNTARGTRMTVSAANLVDYAHDNASFDGLAGYALTSKSLTKSGPPEQVFGETVTWNYFDVLGVQAGLGRTFLTEDERQGRQDIVILTDALWRDYFGADPSILGRTITLNNEPHDVIGVMPAEFAPAKQFEADVRVMFFVPAAYPDQQPPSHGNHLINVVGRLKSGVSVAQAQADLDHISDDLARQFPDTNSRIRARVAPWAEDVARNVRRLLLILFGAVGFVLLIACANVANLLIVRALARQREISIRQALGASRLQMLIHIAMPGIVLAVLGGAAGLVCGVLTRNVIVGMAPATIPRLSEITLNTRVFAVTALLSLLTAIIAGVIPVLPIRRGQTAASLKSTDLTTSAPRSVMWWRGALMASEVAAAVILSVGAGLLIRSLIVLNGVDLGFTTEHVLTMNVNLPQLRYPDARARLMFFEDLERRVTAIPGVQAAAFANRFPLHGGWGGSLLVDSAGGPTEVDADFQAVSVAYFSTLGIPLVRGRLFMDTDRRGTPPVAMVSQTFVRHFIPGDPIGRQFRRNPDEPLITIVGVVGEVRRDGKAAQLTPQVYLPAAQTDLYPAQISFDGFAVRAANDPRSLIRAIRREVAAIDPDQPIAGVQTLDEALSGSFAERRFNLLLLGGFAALSVVLSTIGIYGVVAYAVTQRRYEIGIRVALGAAKRDIIALLIASGLKWSLLGVLLGLAGAFTTTQVLTGLLFGIQPLDTATFATVALSVVAVALTACYLPARKATSINPMLVLRSE
jgi:predicted permease